MITVVGALASFWLLSAAMKGLPVGTADAVWVGIGTVGTAVAAMILMGEPGIALRVAGIALIVAGIAVFKLAWDRRSSDKPLIPAFAGWAGSTAQGLLGGRNPSQGGLSCATLTVFSR